MCESMHIVNDKLTNQLLLNNKKMDRGFVQEYCVNQIQLPLVSTLHIAA